MKNTSPPFALDDGIREEENREEMNIFLLITLHRDKPLPLARLQDSLPPRISKGSSVSY
jgi:hypothetical protein